MSSEALVLPISKDPATRNRSSQLWRARYLEQRCRETGKLVACEVVVSDSAFNVKIARIRSCVQSANRHSRDEVSAKTLECQY